MTSDLNYILREVETKSAVRSLVGRRLSSALITILTVCLGISASPTAKATSLSGQGITVDVFFYLGNMSPANTEEETMGPVLIGSGLSIPSHALDLTSIDIESTQIVLTSASNLPYCSTGDVPCQDSFTGFEFKFSAGVDITGVSVDPSSSASMSPISGGLTLPSPNDLLVNLTGDSPAVGNQLILDLTFPSSSVPEPSTTALWGIGLGAMAVGRRLRKI